MNRNLFNITRKLSSSSFLRSFSSTTSTTSTVNLHKVASAGFTSDSASSYNEGRPSYSNESIEHIINILKKNNSNFNNKTFLELGAGTGKFTFSFLNYIEKQATPSSSSSTPVDSSLFNFKYIISEPSDGFLTSLKDLSKEKIKNPNLFQLDFENFLSTKINLPSNTLDGIIIAQAFHWMAYEESLLEILRVLKSGAPLILIWNTYDYSEEWVKKLEQQVLEPAYYREKIEDEVPRQQTGKWINCFHEYEKNYNNNNIKNYQNTFQFPLQSTYLPYRYYGNENMIYQRLLSTSVVVEKINTIPGYKENTEKIISNIINNAKELDECRKTNQFYFPYVTEIVSIIKK